jgi:iron complex transport system substrate-binding protein
MSSSFPLREPRLGRRSLAGAFGLALVAGLSACGSGSDSTSADTGTSGGGDFPVTIRHKFGSTTITGAPQRVVTIGLTDQDAVLALGTVPVATTDWFGDDPGRIFPWAQKYLGDAPVPEVLSSEQEFEKVAALKPDLILALYAGISAKDYRLYSAIAPTVAAPKGYVDYGVPWQRSTRIIGTALGKPAEASALVRKVDTRFAAARKAHPEFTDATAAMVTLYEGIFVYGSEDPRGRFLTSLGFTFPPSLAKVGQDSYGGSISVENAQQVDVDALVWLDAEKSVAKQVPTYAELRVGKQGRGVFVPESDPLYAATSFQTVLSLPFLLDGLVPRLTAAVDGDPDTPTG